MRMEPHVPNIPGMPNMDQVPEKVVMIMNNGRGPLSLEKKQAKKEPNK